MMWNHGDWGSWGAGGWLAMSLMMLLFWGLLALLAIWLVRTLRDRPPRAGGDEPRSPIARADEVLAERFARGEIDADEYTRRRQVLFSSANRS